jgi:hypothetical protein
VWQYSLVAVWASKARVDAEKIALEKPFRENAKLAGPNYPTLGERGLLRQA